jgi:hypothetical protein
VLVKDFLKKSPLWAWQALKTCVLLCFSKEFKFKYLKVTPKQLKRKITKKLWSKMLAGV